MIFPFNATCRRGEAAPPSEAKIWRIIVISD
jgi:hypothetical protein